MSWLLEYILVQLLFLEHAFPVFVHNLGQHFQVGVLLKYNKLRVTRMPIMHRISNVLCDGVFRLPQDLKLMVCD